MKSVLPWSFSLLVAFNTHYMQAQTGESKYKTVKIHTGNSGGSVDQTTPSEVYKIDVVCEIDRDIPQSDQVFPYRYALIIGNEDYSSHQTKLSEESNVEFAARDASLFREYAARTLGIPEGNILFKIDAGEIEMKRMLEKIKLIMKHSNGQAEIFVYYAGHGFPDVNTKVPYLIPVDVTVNDLEYAVKLSDMYALLSEYPSKRVTVFLDACFSGGGRDLGLLTGARAVRINPKTDPFKGNLVVYSASTASQTALPYEEKEHGLFTYFLLKKIQETNGDVSYAELFDYLKSNVPIKSIMINDVEQTPLVNTSTSLGNSWKEWRIKE
jgi:hypothetical protein